MIPLHCEGVPLATIADAVGTPAFVYSEAGIAGACDAVHRALSFTKHLVAYAVKANGNLAVLARIGRAGCGADIVSGGELARALRAGIDPARIVFSGVGKSDEAIRAALDARIRAIHAESAAELDVIESVARDTGRPAPIALRINPDVDARTHPYIATGIHDTKFGLELDAARALLPRILRSSHLRLEGIACHIGSQIPSADPLREAVARTTAFARECVAAGAPIRCLDAGGGWPVAYGDEDAPFPSWAQYGEAIRDGLGDFATELIVEPGRALVATAGLLLTRVLFVKEQAGKRFVIVDAAMTELIRPALYDAYHAVETVAPAPPGAPLSLADVVGPVCETGDFLALNRQLPPLTRGDLLAIRNAGAYGFAMSSQYNARPRAAEVLVEGDNFRVVRARESYEDLWRGETT